MDVFLIFLVAAAGGCLPLLVRWSDRTLHAALAFSTGIFMGAVFLHLLPELAMQSAQLDTHQHAHAAAPAGADELPGLRGLPEIGGVAQVAGLPASSATQGMSPVPRNAALVPRPSPPKDDAHAGHGHGDTTLWMFVLLGVLGVYLIETLVFPTDEHDDVNRHKAVGYAALTGLCIHALTAGVAYSMTRGNEDVANALFIAIIAHKGFETFSLTSVFQLAEFSRKRVLVLTLLFALVTPVGVWIGGALKSGLGETGYGILNALAAGTFLYVCLCELLTEVFHHREDGIAKLGLLGAGVGLMLLTHA